MYICKYCGNGFNKPQGLNGHLGHCEKNPKNKVEFTCDFCGKAVKTLKQFNQHINYCELNPDHKVWSTANTKKQPLPIINEPCQYCGSICKNINSLKSHERLCSKNPNRSVSNIEIASKEGKITSWNKGKTKYTDKRVAENSMAVARYYETHEGTFKGKNHSDKTKKLLSEKVTEIFHTDANRVTRTFHGWYDNIYFMSGWELAYYIYMKDAGIALSRCTKRFEYYFKGKKHYYYPDFELPDGTIIEVKGMEHEKDIAKYASVPGLVILRDAELLPMVAYVKEKFKTDNLQDLLITNKEG